MMELLVRHGADVNGLCWGWFPVLFTPCENLQPEPLQWFLDHGADPNRGCPHDPGTTALDYAIQTYPRDPKHLAACSEILLTAGAHTRYDVPGLLPIVRGRTDAHVRRITGISGVAIGVGGILALPLYFMYSGPPPAWHQLSFMTFQHRLSATLDLRAHRHAMLSVCWARARAARRGRRGAASIW